MTSAVRPADLHSQHLGVRGGLADPGAWLERCLRSQLDIIVTAP
jgi:hypothetical protein